MVCVPTGQAPQFDQEAGGFGTESDCVVAVPDRTVGGAARAGAVEVDQTGAGRVVLTRASIGQGAGVGDRFGAAIDYTNFDGDAYDDLVIGAPGVAGAGRVYVVFGSAAGLGQGRATHVLGIGLRAGTDYGTTLATSTVYQADFVVHQRLLVGAPGTRVGTKADAGAVYRYSVRYRSAANGLILPRFTVEKTLTENAFAALRPAKANERFGSPLPRADVATTSVRPARWSASAPVLVR